MAKSKPAGKGLTKSAIQQELADKAGITKKQVQAVFDGLEGIIKRQLKKDGDVFAMPGMLKMRLIRKKAVKGGKKVNNPFKPGEFIITKDKPARNVIKIMALKSLKDLVQ